MAQGYTKELPIDTDEALTLDSDYIVPSQQAVKAYVDGRLSATNATDLTDGGETALHTHDHGALNGLSDDDHTQYLLATGTRAGSTSQAQDFGATGIKADAIAESTAAAGVTVDSVSLKDGDIAPGTHGGTGQAFGARFIEYAATPTTHFRGTNTIPSGYAWLTTGSFVSGAAATTYNYLSDYLRNITTSSQRFLYKSVTTWSNKTYAISMLPSFGAPCGFRVDDGTETNYYQFYMSTASGFTTITLQQNGASDITSASFYYVNSIAFRALIQDTGTQHRMFVSGTNSAAFAVGTLFNTALVLKTTWSPARIGIYWPVGIGSNSSFVDWIYDGEFS